MAMEKMPEVPMPEAQGKEEVTTETPMAGMSPEPTNPFKHLVKLHRVTKQGRSPVYFIPTKVCRVRAMDTNPNEQTRITDDAGDIFVAEEIPDVIGAFQEQGIEFIRLLRKDVPMFFAVHNIVRVRMPAVPSPAEQCEVVDNRGGIAVQTPIEEVLAALDKHLGQVR